MARMQTPLQHAKYGVAAGAIFGSAMWALVVALSDGAEGTAEAVTTPRPSPSYHTPFAVCYTPQPPTQVGSCCHPWLAIPQRAAAACAVKELSVIGGWWWVGWAGPCGALGAEQLDAAGGAREPGHGHLWSVRLHLLRRVVRPHTNLACALALAPILSNPRAQPPNIPPPRFSSRQTPGLSSEA
ncbi:hypothetical protein T484DRAFT_2542838 [Baffinella frigidus]|nr:hypothetical protein T484DRAFT_2542838 [Cryptophyta sp. CCMP2293]